jgi:hypothetical protein
MKARLVSASWIAVWATLVIGISSWTLTVDAAQRGRGRGNQDPAADPFVGVTTGGSIEPGLFAVRTTGVSTGPVRDAARRFLASLTDEQRARTAYAVDDIEWRLWNNVHRYARQGVSFEEMTETQRERGFALMRAGLSARGFEQSRDIMRLNGYLAEVLDRFGEYGEFLYHLTVMGVPSDSEPWGWQLDGHHLVVNYFVLGDQVVMTPTFLGSEPVTATSGQYAGASVLQVEERVGLAFMQALTADQRATATIETEKTGNNAVAQAFRDNLRLDYTGLGAAELSAGQQDALMEVVAAFVGHLDDGHAALWLADVRAHLDDTWFAWVGKAGPDDVFYYRVHSPVILIEFDHQMPVALGGPRVPGKAHVHAVVRTPNGNDYGKDLLRQHYEDHDADPVHGHPHVQ